MAVLQKILSFIWTILLLVGKLLCLTVRLVLSLFLLVLQLVLVIFHAGSSIKRKELIKSALDQGQTPSSAMHENYIWCP